MRSLFSTKQLPQHSSAGFGLIELLVTIGIMLLVTTVVLARHSAFNSAILLRNQAYSVAFSIREAQQQAVSIVGDSGDFRPVYGVHFQVGSGGFPSFRDADSNDFYETGDTTLFSGQNILDSRFRVSDIRAYSGSTAVAIPGTPPIQMSITFVRPNFDARFKSTDTGSLLNLSDNVDRVEIEIELVDSTARRVIEVTSTGQISVRTP